MVEKRVSELPIFDGIGLGSHVAPSFMKRLENCGWILLGLALTVSAALVVYGSVFWIAGAI